MNKNFNWEEKKINLQDLLLDEENHRLKIDRNIQSHNQQSILENLIVNDDILSLAKQISQYGFVPVEKMIVLKKRNKYTVLEGNRRLAALKCLNKPNLAKQSRLINDFKKLQDSLSIPQEIPVFIAPSRDEALAKFIIPKHTEPSVKKWATYNKAKVYAKMILDQGREIDEVCKTLSLEKDNVLEFLRMYQCYEIATKLTLNDKIMEKVLDERIFPITTLDRFIKFREGQIFLGIEFNKCGKLKGKIKKEEFVKGYSKLIIDLAKKEQTSRTLHTKEQIIEYTKSFRNKEKPNLDEKGSFTFQSFKQPQSSISRRSKKSKINNQTLHDYQFNILSGSSIIRKIYEEVKDLNFDKKPYSFAVLFRTFLQLCCLQYARNTKILTKIKEKNENKNEDPTLHNYLTFFKNDNVFQDNGVTKSIEKFLNKQNNCNMTTLNTLNQVNHGNTLTISGEQHGKMLDTLEQLLRYLLKKPPDS